MLLIVLAWHAGGYFPQSYLAAGSAALALLAIIFVLRPPHYTWSSAALLALAALGAYTLWTGISLSWTSSPVTGLEDMQRDLVYVALFALGLVAAGSGRHSRQLVWVILGVIVVIVGAGVLSRIVPHLVPNSASPSADGYRLSYPLQYWNSFGALAAVGFTLALGLAGDPKSPRVLRTAAAGATVVLAAGTYLSLSRGAVLASIVGVVVLLVLSGHRASTLLSYAIVGGGVAIAISTLASYPALVDWPTRDGGQVAAGHRFLPVLIAVVLVVSGLQALVAWTQSSGAAMEVLGPPLRIVYRATIAAVLIGTVAAYALNASSIDRSVGNYVSRSWHDFVTPSGLAQTGTARFDSIKGNRAEAYRVALLGFKANPLRGDGAGGFELRFMRQRKIEEKVRNAHSLYLETLDELGLVGLVLILGFLACIVAAVVRSRLKRISLGRSQVAAVTAAVAVWVVHAGVDWDWQMPAVTGAVLILAGSLFPYGRRRTPRRRRRRRIRVPRFSRETVIKSPASGGSPITL